MVNTKRYNLSAFLLLQARTYVLLVSDMIITIKVHDPELGLIYVPRFSCRSASPLKSTLIVIETIVQCCGYWQCFYAVYFSKICQLALNFLPATAASNANLNADYIMKGEIRQIKDVMEHLLFLSSSLTVIIVTRPVAYKPLPSQQRTTQ